MGEFEVTLDELFSDGKIETEVGNTPLALE